MSYGLGLGFMSAEATRIAAEINNHIGGFGYQGWYAGITDDPQRRLFTEHNIDRQNGVWIFRPCSSDDVAREVEQHFLDKGCKGGPGGGDKTTKYVYAYKVTYSTIE